MNRFVNTVYLLSQSVLLYPNKNHTCHISHCEIKSTLGELQSEFCKNLTEFYQISLKKLPYLTDFSPQLMACMKNYVTDR